jgi:hypothetical protein
MTIKYFIHDYSRTLMGIRVFKIEGGCFDSLDFMSYLCGYDNDRHITGIFGGYHPDGGGHRAI